jgi:hypothetical protein
MKNISAVGRPRTITTDKLDSIQRMAKARSINLVKTCKMQHIGYGSVLAAAKALKHPVLKMVKRYKARTPKTTA